MQIATTRKTERTLSALVSRVFDITGPEAASVRVAAEAALREANPHLRDLTELPEGVAVVVPDVPGAGRGADDRPDAPAALLAAEVRRALARLASHLEAAAGREEADARDMLELLASRDVKALGKTSPALAERLPGFTAAATARLKDAQTLASFGKTAVAAAGRDVGEMFERSS